MEALVKSEKKLNPNVDFYSASMSHTLGIPIDLYTPIFAVSHVGLDRAHPRAMRQQPADPSRRADYVSPAYTAIRAARAAIISGCMITFARRVFGAAMLDRRVYEDVEADVRSTGQAVAVVVLASVAGGIGLLGLGGQTPQSLATGIVGSLIGWLAWAALTYLIGLLPEPQTRADAELREQSRLPPPWSFARPRSDPGPRRSPLRNRVGVDAAGDDRRRPPGARLPEHRPRGRRVRRRVGSFAGRGSRHPEYLHADHRVLTRAAVTATSPWCRVIRSEVPMRAFATVVLSATAVLSAQT